MTEETKHAPISDALLPCPFCGGVAEHHDIGNWHTKSRGTKIWCAQCFFSKTVKAVRQDLDWTRSQAIAAWNRRAHSLPSAVTDEMVERALAAQPHNSPISYFLNPNHHLAPEAVRELMRAALSAALSLPIAQPAGVRVKPLAWGERRGIHDVNWAWDAKTSIGWYVVATASGEGCRGTHYWFVAGDTIKGWAMSEEEAKAAADADHAFRILSAIEAAPPIDRASVIEECAKVADEHALAWGLAMGSGAKEIAKSIRDLTHEAK